MSFRWLLSPTACRTNVSNPTQIIDNWGYTWQRRREVNAVNLMQESFSGTEKAYSTDSHICVVNVFSFTMHINCKCRECFFFRRGPPPWEKMPKYLGLVGATSSCIVTRVANRPDSDGRHTVPGPTAAVVEILAPTQQERDDSRSCCNFDASPGNDVNTHCSLQ